MTHFSELIRLQNAFLNQPLAEAEAALKQAAQPDMLAVFAVWAIEKGFPDQALWAFEEAASHAFQPELYLDWVNSLLLLRHYEQAHQKAEFLLKHLPREPIVQAMYAMTCERLQDLDTARNLYLQALQAAPDEPMIHYNLSSCLLLAGQYQRGWSEHEWRLSLSPEHQDYAGIPRWQGQARQGRGLLVYTEQGFGDSLQFSRCLNALDRRDGPIFLSCQSEVAELMKTAYPHVEIVDEGTELEISWQIALMSLPAVLNWQEHEIQAHSSPYLAVPKVSVHQKGAGLKVGLVWSSGQHKGLAAYAHQGKSVPLQQFRQALPQSETITYYNFQTGSERDQGLAWPALQALPQPLASFTQTAIALQQMDLLISVDTASVHLAGAMNLETWALIPYAPNWRWQLERSDTPWYPSMRLFRQASAFSWDAPLTQISQALKARLQK